MPAANIARVRGFTLLEMLVVMLLLGLALAVTPPLFSGAVPGMRLKGAARDLVAGMRQARSLAIFTNTPTPLRLEPAAGRFSVPGQSQTHQLPGDIAVQVLPAVDGEPAAVREVWFYPDGGASGEHIVLTRDALGYRIELDWLTGRAVIRELPHEG